MSWGQGERERLLANIIRIGTVTAVDPARARARVTFGGETESAWIAWAAARAGSARVWAPVAVGEQVVVAAPGGDTAQAVILASLFQSARPAPSADGAAWRIAFDDGVSVTRAGGRITIVSPGPVTVQAPLVEVPSGDVVASGISLRHHVHGGVMSGPSKTAPPG